MSSPDLKRYRVYILNEHSHGMCFRKGTYGIVLKQTSRFGCRLRRSDVGWHKEFSTLAHQSHKQS